jgi:hypothetical protein
MVLSRYLFWTLAVVGVVLHAEVVPHLVGHGGGHQADDVTVPHAHATGELVGADGTLQRLAHHPGVELDPRQQLPEQKKTGFLCSFLLTRFLKEKNVFLSL